MRASACRRTVEPSAQPVTIGQMRSHLRLSGHEEDAVVTAAIAAAVSAIEEQTRRALITQTWVAYITEAWPAYDAVFLPRPRLLSVVAVQYRNTAGTWTTSTNYRLQDASEPSAVWLTSTPADVATPETEQDAVWRITYIAGYGVEPNAVPDTLRAAVKLLAAHLFEAREPVVVGTIVSELPLGIDRLIAPFRVPWGGTNL